VRGKKGEHKDIFTAIQREGFVRVRVDGDIYDVRNVPDLSKNKKHDIAALVDRLIIKDTIRVRLADSIETALKLAEGVVLVLVQEPAADKKNGGNGKWKEVIYSEKFACPKHPQASLEELSPRLFSFNSPYNRRLAQGRQKNEHLLQQAGQAILSEDGRQQSDTVQADTKRARKDFDVWDRCGR